MTLQGYSIIGSAISSGIGAIAEASAFKSRLAAQREADFSTARNFMTSYELQQAQNAESISNLNSLLADKMSEMGLNSLKEASMLKAASAETGTSGGTTAMSIEEAYLNENLDKANVIAQATQQKRSMLSTIETGKVSARNSIDSMLLGGSVDVATNTALSGIAGGLSGGLGGLSFLTDSQKSKLFGV